MTILTLITPMPGLHALLQLRGRIDLSLQSNPKTCQISQQKETIL